MKCALPVLVACSLPCYRINGWEGCPAVVDVCAAGERVLIWESWYRRGMNEIENMWFPTRNRYHFGSWSRCRICFIGAKQIGLPWRHHLEARVYVCRSRHGLIIYVLLFYLCFCPVVCSRYVGVSYISVDGPCSTSLFRYCTGRVYHEAAEDARNTFTYRGRSAIYVHLGIFWFKSCY